MRLPKPTDYTPFKRMCYRVLLCGVIFSVYLPVQYILLIMTRNNAAMAISVLPIIAAGILWDWKASVMMGIGVFIAGTPLMRNTILAENEIPKFGIGFIMIGFYTLIGVLVGKMSEMDRRLKAELALRLDTERRLRVSNNELADFAHIASHDLHEPLRKITAFGDRLASHAGDMLDDKARDYLARMQHAAERMGGLLDGLLSYARVTTTGSPFVPVDMDTVVKEVLGDLEIRISETAGTVEKGTLGTVRADPLQMRQLFQNLVGNALKYHKPDVPPVVKIESAVTRDKAWYELTVRDNGIGIAEEDKEKAFGIFQRLVGKGAYEGHGVGLSICKKIAERHGGTIDLQGTPGEGTVFTVRLPVRREIQGAVRPHSGTTMESAA